MIKGIRYTDPAWGLLKHLSASQAEVVQCSDPTCLRFHIREQGVIGSVVRNSVVRTLVAAGLLTRARTLSPAYSVSPKGVREVQRELRRRDFLDSLIRLEHNCGAASKVTA